MNEKNIIQVFGPTGVGKSGVSVKIAKNFSCEIISADSMQVYKDFNIGTDKITEDKTQGIPHHLIDMVSDCSQFNASKFLELSFKTAENIIGKNKIPLVCGGTPLYQRVIREGIFPEKKKDGKIREILKEEIKQRGREKLWERLLELDPVYCKKINKNDEKRIIRGLEIYLINNIIPSEIFKHTKTPFQKYNFIRIGLNIERELLYERINHRVDEMIKNGLTEEVKALKQKYNENCPPFSSLGYREILSVLKNEIDLQRGIELIKQHSRNYAKRQLSWFRSEKETEWFKPSDIDRIFEFIEKKLL